MSRPRKYPSELLDRGARVVIESGRPIAHVAGDLGVPSETLRKYVRRVEADKGLRPDLPTAAEREEIRQLARGSTSSDERTRSSRRRRCFSRPSSTQTDRSEPLHRRAPRPLRRRADLHDPGRVGVRLLPAQDRPAVAAGGAGRVAAQADRARPRRHLLLLRVSPHVAGAQARRRRGRPRPRQAADARPRDPGRQAARQAVAHHDPEPRGAAAAGPREP
jgi:transposase